MNEGMEKPAWSEEDVARVRQKYMALAKRPDTELYNRKTAFLAVLETKYGKETVLSYRLFHLLLGSTPRKEMVIPLFDFTGEDSIENFLDSQLKE
jgi:hypothetical protein